MDPAAVPPTRPVVPRIREDAAPSRPLSPNKRVLLLTDSINCGLDTHLFHGSGLTCIKEPQLFELANIDKYESEFQYTDYVIISAGVNDLSRYGHSAVSIAKFMCNKIRLWVNQFPNTMFIFNSILSTDYLWLNRRIKIVNKAMFNLSLDLYNTARFYFLDTHARLLNSNIQRILSPSGNGVHLSYAASSLVQRCIVDSVVALDQRDASDSIRRVWPIRQEFRQGAAAFHAWRGRCM